MDQWYQCVNNSLVSYKMSYPSHFSLNSIQFFYKTYIQSKNVANNCSIHHHYLSCLKIPVTTFPHFSDKSFLTSKSKTGKEKLNRTKFPFENILLVKLFLNINLLCCEGNGVNDVKLRLYLFCRAFMTSPHPPTSRPSYITSTAKFLLFILSFSYHAMYIIVYMFAYIK